MLPGVIWIGKLLNETASVSGNKLLKMFYTPKRLVDLHATTNGGFRAFPE